MKTFEDLQTGDKVFELFPDNTVGIYEISEIDQTETLTRTFVSFDIIKIINSHRNWKYFTVRPPQMNQSHKYSAWFKSMIFADEDDFLVELKKRQNFSND